MEIILFVLWWAIPLAIISYLFRALQTIILGMRSMNSLLQRATTAVEELARWWL